MIHPQPDESAGRNSVSPFRRTSYRQWFTATTLLAVSTSTTLAVTLVLIEVTGSISTAGPMGTLVPGRPIPINRHYR